MTHNHTTGARVVSFPNSLDKRGGNTRGHVWKPNKSHSQTGKPRATPPAAGWRETKCHKCQTNSSKILILGSRVQGGVRQNVTNKIKLKAKKSSL